MGKGACGGKGLLFAFFVTALLVATACGTFDLAVEEPAATTVPLGPSVAPTERPEPTLAVATTAQPRGTPAARVPAVGWYGQIHSVAGADPGYDYLKFWHLAIWPKFGRAVGIASVDPAINAEIERIRDTDVGAYFWGTLTCGVGDYGACQLLVSRLSASDGGPTFAPDRVDGWEGTIGQLPVQPGSEEKELLFTLVGAVPVVYGISGANPSLQAELERLVDAGTQVRIWGELSMRARAQPASGAHIDVERLEVGQTTTSP